MSSYLNLYWPISELRCKLSVLTMSVSRNAGEIDKNNYFSWRIFSSWFPLSSRCHKSFVIRRWFPLRGNSSEHCSRQEKDIRYQGCEFIAPSERFFIVGAITLFNCHFMNKSLAVKQGGNREWIIILPLKPSCYIVFPLGDNKYLNCQYPPQMKPESLIQFP